MVGELRTVEFVVQDAGAGGHPLHIAGTDQAAAAAGIAVRHIAFVHQSDGLKATMWMHADTAWRSLRRKVQRPGVVE